ncbi:MAG: hypothetical protein K1X29_02965 [Bdellovibrionales bacterium]|nr:hypothetical protein [Bdellovibrionales bacterium]
MSRDFFGDKPIERPCFYLKLFKTHPSELTINSTPHVAPSSPHVAPSSPHVAPSSPHVAPSSPHVAPENEDLGDVAYSKAPPSEGELKEEYIVEGIPRESLVNELENRGWTVTLQKKKT